MSDTEKLDTVIDIKKPRKKKHIEPNLDKITHNVKVWEMFFVNKTS